MAKKRAWLEVGFVLVIGSIGACSSTPVGSVNLTVFAASSLTETLTDLANVWQGAHPSNQVLISSGSSAALRTQIEQGAPADVFLSADTSNPQQLVDAGLATGPVTAFALNSLTIIVPASNPAGVASAVDLAKPGVCVIAAGDDVPITKYATKLVGNLATLPGYGQAFADGYAANVCSKEDSVGAVVSKVALGEGDAAIVYVSDANGTGLTTIDVPAGANVVATYGGVAIKTSPAAAMDAEFLTWLRGADAQALFAAHGFAAAP
jgi:molybdate transport system substrate-binding protein